MLCAVTLIVALFQQPQAVTRPPLNGVWVGEAGRLVLTLAGDSLTVTTGSRSPMAFKMDGSPSRNVTKTAAGTEWKHESTARWVGNAALIVTKTTRETGASWEWLAIYSLEPGTGNLTAVTVDYAHKGGEGMVTRTSVYRRGASGR